MNENRQILRQWHHDRFVMLSLLAYMVWGAGIATGIAAVNKGGLVWLELSVFAAVCHAACFVVHWLNRRDESANRLPDNPAP